VKTIGNLQCVRCAFTCALGISASSIPADDFDSWVSLQPFLQSFRLSIRQKVNRLVTLQIDQNGSVSLAFPPCPVIHTKGSDMRLYRGAHILLQYAQNRIGAGGDTELRGKAESGFATQGVTDPLQRLTMAIGLSTIRHGEIWEPFREYLAMAIPRSAIEAPSAQLDPNASTLPRKIAEGPAILTVNITGTNTTSWAGCGFSG
jgi:hypothetical protein